MAFEPLLLKMNNGTFSERLKKLMGDMSRAEFADKCGISVGALRNYLEDGMPSADKALRIARLFNVTIEWLIEGVDPVHPGEHQTQKLTDYVGIPRYDASLSAGNGFWNQGKAEVLDHIPFTPEFLRRRLGRSTAEGLLIMSANGESMEPQISDGDLVMVDQRKQTLSDGIFAFVLNGEARIKWLRKTISGDIEVISLNQSPLFPKETIRKDELEGFQLIGKVVWCGHHFAR
ncbi:Phage repressor protein C, contains Cro/C1-type HTH and peptisase s24 domains [Cohaesibacter sp. ES.047]|uniref:XRE family transcriptional regulator n=1 Tax=Cohaesibacter sp. ES.047 TaxID=1798205 RepID=UPI000BB8977D|nr:S24 family peptidase [Cohaesibacter sp. ES.047]SNY91416.1 Phage repressor protein C, contains Cro/C1-type HTH and peptisase s24 domains [Cohaesibacter sp. ES.047]